MIDISKAAQSVVEKYLGHYGLDMNGELKEQAERLAEHVEGEVEALHIVDCQECGAPTDDRIDVCVLCGIGGDIAEDDEGEMQTQEVTSTKKPKPNPANQKKKTRKAKKKVELVKVDGQVTATPAAIAQAGAKLDTKVREYNALRTNAVLGFWKVGRKLLEIYDGNLHRARHETWKSFAAAELDISLGFSYKLMDIALLFTENDVAEVGVSKLQVMVQLQDEDRKKILARVKNDKTTFARVRDEVMELAAGKPRRVTGRSEQAKKASSVGNKKIAEKAKKSKKQLVAATVEPGTVRLKMLAKTKKGEDLASAHKVEDEPWCQEETVDGMRITYKLVRTNGGLVLVINRKLAKA